MTYRELLSEGCPPDDAWEITAHRAVYRLVRNNPPTDDDFRSQRAEKPAPGLSPSHRVPVPRGVGIRRPT